MSFLTFVLLMGAGNESMSRLNRVIGDWGEFKQICDHPVGMWMLESNGLHVDELVTLIEANAWGGGLQLFTRTEDESRFTEYTGLRLRKRIAACMVRSPDDTEWVSGRYLIGRGE